MDENLRTAGNIASIVSLLIVVIPVINQRVRKIIADGGLLKAGFGILILIAIVLNGAVLFDRYGNRAAEQPKSQLATPHSQLPPAADVQLPAIPKEDRIFISKDPKEIRGMLEGKMTSEQSRIIAPFIGKWMNLSVIVGNISLQRASGTLYVGDFMKNTKMIFVFKEQWIPCLEILDKGQKVNVLGRIKEINDLVITFEDCELS